MRERRGGKRQRDKREETETEMQRERQTDERERETREIDREETETEMQREERDKEARETERQRDKSYFRNFHLLKCFDATSLSKLLILFYRF